MELRGDLQSFPLAQLIQTLDGSQRTGKLNIEGHLGNFAVFFQNGKVIHAQSPYSNGLPAFFDVFLEHEGTFSFISSVTMPPKTITQGNASLLIRATELITAYEHDSLKVSPEVQLQLEHTPSAVPISLTEDEFKLLQAAIEPVVFGKVLRDMEFGFFRTWIALKGLANKKMITLSKTEA